MNEIWKDVKGYEGLYKVSNTGKVYSYKRNREMRTNGQRYFIVNLRKNNSAKVKYVHRLVAEAFIPNPGNLPQVNHIDQNPHNNNIENLEWTSRMDNINKYLKSNKYKHILATQRRRTK